MKISRNAFNNVFINITSDLGLKGCESSCRSFENLGNRLGSFKENPSSKRIRTNSQTNDGFIFKDVTKEEVRQEMINLDSSKTTSIRETQYKYTSRFSY